MTMEPLTIEIEELTPEQAAEIWQEQKTRPANFPQIVVYLRAKAIGQAFDVKVDQSPERNEQHARDIRKWFGVAARERTIFNEAGGEIPAPVAIRWREQSHKVKQQVMKDGKRGEVEVNIIDRLHGKVIDVSSLPGRNRGGSDDEQVDDIVNSLPNIASIRAAGAKTADLPDGRKAKMTRSGHWRAPKTAATASSNGQSAPTDGATNGVTTDDKVAVGAA